MTLVSKYSEFNLKVQELLHSRLITPTEFSAYYSFMEKYNASPQYLLSIIEYCVRIKGPNIRHPYIITVATNKFIQENDIELVFDNVDTNNKLTLFKYNLQKLISKRIVSNTESASYLSFIENHHISTDFLLKIVERCCSLRDKAITSQYVFFIANKLLKDGISTENLLERTLDSYILKFPYSKP